MQLLSSIITACKPCVLGGAEYDICINTIVIDSRKIIQSKNALFVAINTATKDGHEFIADAYNKGVRCFLIGQEINHEKYPNAIFLKVPNTIAALQSIAIYIRNQFDIPVIGITGSNGKTIIKEWLNQLLQAEYNIVRSPQSYNSQIGVPLSVWQMEAQHTLGIFEAGISLPNEMGFLERIIKPSLGVFTNIGEAHNQGFENRTQKISEKLLLFQRSETLIYCSDYQELEDCILLLNKSRCEIGVEPIRRFSWSYKQDADLQIVSVEKISNESVIGVIYQNDFFKISIPFTDSASIENAIHCCCVLLYFKIPIQKIQLGMLGLRPIAMRLELRQGENNCTIINDSYNSDFTSLQIALDLLEQQKQHKFKTVILSDLEQTGKDEQELYQELATIINARKVQKFYGIGASLRRYKVFFERNSQLETHFFENTELFLQEIQQFSFENEAILIKGARSFAFENLSLILEHKIHQTVMTVNLSAMCNNLDVFRRRLKPEVKTMAMVKASSYGSGGYEIANALQQANIDYLTVAYVDEGVALRRAKIDLPIMVMSPSAQSFDRMIEWNLEPEIFNLRSLTQFLSVAKKLDVIKYPVHIKLDTGMHRLGFIASEIPALLSLLIKEGAFIKVASIFSHLAASDDTIHESFTHYQANLFQEMSQQIMGILDYKPLRHICNSAGIVMYPEYHFDMVRLGLGLYGIDSTGTIGNQLQQISTLRTTIAQIKSIPAGETIGYSRRGKATKDMRIATICIGYADGYPRKLSNGDSYVMVNNKPAKLIGSIAMDMCMVDITNIDAVQEGDEVIIFGDALPIQQLANWAGTIPYEIMTSISQRVKRIYVNEGA